MIGVCMDVTEQKEAELALLQAEERFRTLATRSPVGIFQTDAQGHCLFVNETWCAIAGASQEDALGDGWQQFVHAEDQDRIVKQWKDATLRSQTSIAEFRFLNPEMGVRWVIGSATVILDTTGR